MRQLSEVVRSKIAWPSGGHPITAYRPFLGSRINCAFRSDASGLSFVDMNFEALGEIRSMLVRVKISVLLF